MHIKSISLSHLNSQSINIRLRQNNSLNVSNCQIQPFSQRHVQPLGRDLCHSILTCLIIQRQEIRMVFHLTSFVDL